MGFWRWGTSILQNPSHRYTDTGFFSVRLIATNNGCPDTLTKINYIKVLPPIARFTAVPNCANRLQFTFTDQSVAPVTWQWNFGDGSPVSIIQSPVHIFPALGAYNVTLIVTNGGCADTVTNPLQAINENPDFIADQLTACKRATIQFYAIKCNFSQTLLQLFLGILGMVHR